MFLLKNLLLLFVGQKTPSRGPLDVVIGRKRRKRVTRSW